MTVDPAFIYLNYAEAGLWAVSGVITLVKTGHRIAGLTLGLALLAFGASDIVETRTGAWYSPWWMLAWKAACIAIILASGTSLHLARRRKD